MKSLLSRALFSTQKQSKLLMLKSFQQKMNSMNLKNLSPLPREEKKGMQRIVGNFFANFEELDIFKIKEPFKTDDSQNTPSNSWVQLNIPITTNETVQSVMFRFDNQIRIGRLLEFLDLFAGYIGYQHCHLDKFAQKMTLVTACVDNVEFYCDLSTQKDIVLKGYVTYVGKTSIEVKIDIYQINDSSNQEDLIGTSLFLMVARNSLDHSKGVKDEKLQDKLLSTKKFKLKHSFYEFGLQNKILNKKNSVEVPQLVLDKDEENIESCQYRYQLGLKNQRNRKMKWQLSFQTAEPTNQESKLLHQFFINPNNYLQHTPIQNTRIEDIQIMQFENRNVHNKIFGGFLMRKLIESGWACGFLHVKGIENPKMVYLSDIQFHNPVEIGSLVSFKSHVCYSIDNYMDVKIEATVINPSNKNLNQKTTEMHLILECSHPIPPVFPQQYEHGILYLEGKRVIEQFLGDL